MQNFTLHPEAEIDLAEILDYLEDESPAAADSFLDQVESALLSLVRFPHQGYRRPNLTSLPLRFKLVGEYAIAYAPDAEPLWVVAVFHGRRSPRVIAAMLRGREQQALHQITAPRRHRLRPDRQVGHSCRVREAHRGFGPVADIIRETFEICQRNF